MNCVVVIPIYKKYVELTNSEKKSIIQCFRILQKHQIVFICPEFFRDINLYNELAKQENTSVEFKEFRKIYFENIDGYNRLLISHEFYNCFSSFDYMLIYQTDAYVFSDQLDYWCHAEYDYIGSPWFEGYSDPISNKLIGVGNGGFSLRNVKKSLLIIGRLNLFRKLKYFQKKLRILDKIINHFIRIFFYYQYAKPFSEVLHHQNIVVQEDGFWAEYIPELFSDYKVAPIEHAIRFSFEVNPSYLFKLNGESLPFGCHGWNKYDPEFWHNFIP